MVISIIQPCFVPWIGYFEQIAVADVFVFMDDVYYTKKDWRNGNQLKSQYGVKKVSVPVSKTKRDTLIKDVSISYASQWEQTLLNQITEWYKKAPYFEEIMNLIEPVINAKHAMLVDLNLHLNNEILNYLEINTPIYFSSKIERKTRDKISRIIEICKNFEEVDTLYDGKKAEDFLSADVMRMEGIEVVFQDYKHTEYKQLWGDFIPYMSIIDLLMNCGKEAKKYVINDGVINKLIKKYK